MTPAALAAGDLTPDELAAAATSASVSVAVDFVVVAVVLMALAFGVFMAIWGVHRGSGSRIDGLEKKADEQAARLIEVERKISHLPTKQDVHQLDLRVERGATVVETTAKQVDRILDHLMSSAKTAAEEGAR